MKLYSYSGLWSRIVINKHKLHNTVHNVDVFTKSNEQNKAKCLNLLLVSLCYMGAS